MNDFLNHGIAPAEVAKFILLTTRSVSTTYRALLTASLVTLSACSGGDSVSTPAPTSTPSPTPVQHTFALNANGATSGSPLPPAASYAAGQSATIPKVDINITGYTLSGWNTRADGSGSSYSPEGAVTMPDRDITLYAQWKVIPITITQQGGAGESRLLIEWYDGSKQDVVYSPAIIGNGNSYDFNPIVGGIAISATGGARYIHTSYPDDFMPDHQPVMKVTSGTDILINATSPAIANRAGSLTTIGSTETAGEIVVTVTGRLVDLEADAQVELVFRADAPRMMLSRSKITYTRPTSVARMYHQTVHANPTRLSGPITYLYAKGGAIIDSSTLMADLTGGIFYKNEPGYYVGFLAPRDGTLDFYAWRDGPYLAGYKIVYDNVLKNAGDVTETRAVSTFGFNTADARKQLSWAEDLRRGIRPDVSAMSLADRAAAKMISEAFGL